MTTTRFHAILRLLAIATLCESGVARYAHAQVGYDSPKGRVEVLGLHRWTVKMLQDSIRHYKPGQELHDAACMVTLREKLHFPDADVARTESRDPNGVSKSYLVIKVVEPQRVQRVQWDVRERDTYSSLLPDYASVVLPVTDSSGGVWMGRVLNWLQASDSASTARLLVGEPPVARVDAERLAQFLREHHSESDRVRAMRVLEKDGFWANRMVATVVLANFGESDDTWRALVRALRDPDVSVRESAKVALRTLPRRTIDWSQATTDLRLLLGGTNVSATQGVLELLAATSVDPALAPTLLRGNADWVLEHLGVQMPGASYAAHKLLVHFNRGTDLGATREAWGAWAAAL